MINIGDLVQYNENPKKIYHGIVTKIRNLSNEQGDIEPEMLVYWYDYRPKNFGKVPYNTSWIPANALETLGEINV